jgi:hypothetical protein
MKPFTGSVTETSELSQENTVGWDRKPFTAGAEIISEKGPRMLAIEKQNSVEPKENPNGV